MSEWKTVRLWDVCGEASPSRPLRWSLPPLRGSPPQRPQYRHTNLFAANATHGIIEN